MAAYSLPRDIKATDTGMLYAPAIVMYDALQDSIVASVVLYKVRCGNKGAKAVEFVRQVVSIWVPKETPTVARILTKYKKESDAESELREEFGHTFEHYAIREMAPNTEGAEIHIGEPDILLSRVALPQMADLLKPLTADFPIYAGKEVIRYTESKWYQS